MAQVVPEGALVFLRGLKQAGHDAVRYHPDDPNAEMLATATRQLGMTPLPDPEITFRRIEGARAPRLPERCGHHAVVSTDHLAEVLRRVADELTGDATAAIHRTRRALAAESRRARVREDVVALATRALAAELDDLTPEIPRTTSGWAQPLARAVVRRLHAAGVLNIEEAGDDEPRDGRTWVERDQK